MGVNRIIKMGRGNLSIKKANGQERKDYYLLSSGELLVYKYTIYVHCIVGKYIIYLYKLYKQIEKRTFVELFLSVSQRVQINFIFNDDVRMLCLSCNIYQKVQNT